MPALGGGLGQLGFGSSSSYNAPPPFAGGGGGSASSYAPAPATGSSYAPAPATGVGELGGLGLPPLLGGRGSKSWTPPPSLLGQGSSMSSAMQASWLPRSDFGGLGSAGASAGAVGGNGFGVGFTAGRACAQPSLTPPLLAGNPGGVGSSAFAGDGSAFSGGSAGFAGGGSYVGVGSTGFSGGSSAFSNGGLGFAGSGASALGTSGQPLTGAPWPPTSAPARASSGAKSSYLQMAQAGQTNQIGQTGQSGYGMQGFSPMRY